MSRLRDNDALVAEVAGIIIEETDETNQHVVYEVLDAVDRALAAPSPETGTAAVPTRRPLDKAAEWARMSGVDPRDPGPAPEPVKPPATCQCFHAPEQHHRETGCGVVAIMSGRCPCEWNGARTPAAGTEEGRFRCICPDKAKCPNCEWSCLYCRCERRATPEKGGR